MSERYFNPITAVERKNHRLEWVEIVEPRTREYMYANLTTGECVWEPPPGARVKHTDENQWWELFDQNTSRFYYYNATNQKTVWHRPQNCDIIPLAKLQTLKQNTEVTSRPHHEYDEPKSPTASTASSKSTHSTLTPAQIASQTVSCQTQTSPSASPDHRRKHHHHSHHHHHRKKSAPQDKHTTSCQTALSAQPRRLSGSSSGNGNGSLPFAPGAYESATCPRNRRHRRDGTSGEDNRRDRSEGPPSPNNEEPDVHLNSSASTLVHSDATGSQKVLFGNRGVPEQALRKLDALRSPSFDGAFVRSFLSAGSSSSGSFSPSTPREVIDNRINQRTELARAATAGQQQSANAKPLRQLSIDSAAASVPQQSYGSCRPTPVPRQRNAPSTQSFRAAVPNHQYSAEARIVLTSQHQKASTSSSGTQSVDSTPNLPRRQMSFDMSGSPAVRNAGSDSGPVPLLLKTFESPQTPRKQGNDVRQASITTVAGSPRIWKAVDGNAGERAKQAGQKEEASPVWSRTAELSMVKSHDSGIRSGDSGQKDDDSHDSSTGSPRLYDSQSMESQSGQSPLVARPQRTFVQVQPADAHIVKTPKLDTNTVQQQPKPLSLAQPYQQIAQHLTYSQAHQQFILGEVNDSFPEREPESSSSDASLHEEDEDLFADDEDCGHSAHESSSQECLASPRLGRKHSRKPKLSAVYDVPEALEQRSSPHFGQHNHHSHIAFDPLGKIRPIAVLQPLQPMQPPSAQDAQRSTLSSLGGNSAKRLSENGSVMSAYDHLKPVRNLPGDISPPNHRPQSVMVPHVVDLVLPPNTATLTRAKGGSLLSGVSRSASSLMKGQHPLSVSPLAFRDTHMESYAQENLNRHKKGLFRKRQSIQSMLAWTRESIKKPLIMTTDKEIRKDAVDVFRRVQAYMGDRKVKSGLSLDQLALEVCVKGWAKANLRDEIFIQLCKQTTDNPRNESMRRGWELLAICLTFFPPSPKFYSYLDSFINRNADSVLDISDVPISAYAQHCAKKLERIAQTGAKRGSRKPTKEEIEQARVQIFNPSMFGNTLDEVMVIQRDKFPQRRLPWIQITLSDMVLQLGGTKTEGIFRVPGDIDEVNALKVRMDQYIVPPVSDPHVPASLLKLWYRELAQPLIPQEFYDDCVKYAEDAKKIVSIVDRLPVLNRMVLAYLVRFLQLFIRPEHVATTKMDASNLAMVMAPNCLRCQSEDPRVIFDNTRKEMAFMKTLMETYDTAFVEGVL